MVVWSQFVPVLVPAIAIISMLPQTQAYPYTYDEDDFLDLNPLWSRAAEAAQADWELSILSELVARADGDEPPAYQGPSINKKPEATSSGETPADAQGNSGQSPISRVGSSVGRMLTSIGQRQQKGKEREAARKAADKRIRENDERLSGMPTVGWPNVDWRMKASAVMRERAIEQGYNPDSPEEIEKRRKVLEMMKRSKHSTAPPYTPEAGPEELALSDPQQGSST